MPRVHRHGDNRECGATTIVEGQSTFYVDGKLVSVKGDPNTHGNGDLDASINPGTFKVEGKEVVVVGSTAQPDDLCPPLGGAHCNPKATTGSPNFSLFD